MFSASLDYDCKRIGDSLHVYNVAAHGVVAKTPNEIEATLATCGSQFDYLVLAAHGASSGFKEQGKQPTDWYEFGYQLCANQIVKQNGVIFLACCDGGSKETALRLFEACNQLNFVCGVGGDVDGKTITFALQAFVHAKETGNSSFTTIQRSIGDLIRSDFRLWLRSDLGTELMQRDVVRLTYAAAATVTHTVVVDSTTTQGTPPLLRSESVTTAA